MKPQPAPVIKPQPPVHQSLATSLPATTKPRPWAHHSALDLWEAAPEESATSTASATHQGTTVENKPATNRHHQSTTQPDKTLARHTTAKTATHTRLPQTDGQSNWSAVALGSLLLGFTGIWRNRRIHQ
ncbi:LPXTG cell wall anchor domain-containing protein [Levilactobacillus brevis]|nr:LPXTG cell wall anchor domain-containing protein [Levilactobacillus brevis]